MPIAIPSWGHSVWRTMRVRCEIAAKTMLSQPSGFMNGASRSSARWSASGTRARRCATSLASSSTLLSTSHRRGRGGTSGRGMLEQRTASSRSSLCSEKSVPWSRGACDREGEHGGGPRSAAKRAGLPYAYTLHHTPYTLNPTPYTLHPTPYTLHPTP
jgi:hypothetical protein